MLLCATSTFLIDPLSHGKSEVPPSLSVRVPASRACLLHELICPVGTRFFNWLSFFLKVSQKTKAMNISSRSEPTLALASSNACGSSMRVRWHARRQLSIGMCCRLSHCRGGLCVRVRNAACMRRCVRSRWDSIWTSRPTYVRPTSTIVESLDILKISHTLICALFFFLSYHMLLTLSLCSSFSQRKPFPFLGRRQSAHPF